MLNIRELRRRWTPCSVLRAMTYLSSVGFVASVHWQGDMHRGLEFDPALCEAVPEVWKYSCWGFVKVLYFTLNDEHCNQVCDIQR